ncbi:MAG TPA: tetratricopeptide repeat protein [Myxococcales bacterium]|nr:tetratricopeptide repeat protein [Myxococcales bacterium]
MTSGEMEQRAERAVRRGELLVAIEHFEAHLAQHPDDERVRSRMEAVRALLQPSELVSRRRTEPEEPDAATAPAGDAEVGEMHAGSGRFAEAAEAYERAIAANPENELFRERLQELRLLVVPEGKADLGALEKLDGPPPAQMNGAARRVERSAKAAAASFAPLQGAPARPLPREPKALLEELLQRVRSGRRG